MLSLMTSALSLFPFQKKDIRQVGSFLCLSSCISRAWSVEAVQWKVEERLACDKKKSAQVYMHQNSAPICMFSEMEFVIKNYGREVAKACLMHTKKNRAFRDTCRVGDGEAKPQVQVIGFPCAPFSQQRDKSKKGSLRSVLRWW